MDQPQCWLTHRLSPSHATDRQSTIASSTTTISSSVALDSSETVRRSVQARYWWCENCGARKVVDTRTACLGIPELDEKRVKTLELCQPCTDAFDWDCGEGPIGHGPPEARSVHTVVEYEVSCRGHLASVFIDPRGGSGGIDGRRKW